MERHHNLLASEVYNAKVDLYPDMDVLQGEYTTNIGADRAEGKNN